jgi:hypothetical protein
MSPEQAQGLPLDARSDVFSLGVILFELATGKRLFRGPTEFDTFKLIISEPYPAPCAVNPRLAPKLGAIIERALARNPNDRYQSARELQADLEEYVRTAQLSVSALSLSTWMRSLFEEKLTVQEQMLREGQKLADVLAQQAAEEELLRVTDRVSFLPSLAPRPGPPEERGWGKMLIGMLLVLLVAGGTFWYLRRLAASESGAIVVRTDPPGAAIWIDGDRRPERTPATLHGLPVGVTYAVKLTLDGFAPLTQQLPLTQNEPHGAVVVRLEPDGPPPASIARITTTPRGAAVFLDGHDTGQRTPATLTEVRPGVEHRVECILDGYVPAHLVFTTSAGEALDRVVPLERTELRSDEALLIVRVSPPDARVNVLGEWHEGGSPYELRVPARPTRIFVNRVRHYDTDRLVDLAGGRVTEVEFTLTRERGAEEDERADILGSPPRPAAAPAAQDTPVADDARDPGRRPRSPQPSRRLRDGSAHGRNSPKDRDYGAGLCLALCCRRPSRGRELARPRYTRSVRRRGRAHAPRRICRNFALARAACGVRRPKSPFYRATLSSLSRWHFLQHVVAGRGGWRCSARSRDKRKLWR